MGGTVDLLAKRKDGTLWLFDWKTGTGLYSKAILQMAAYFDASPRLATSSLEPCWPTSGETMVSRNFVS